MDKVIAEDVVFDSEPLELADELLSIEESIETFVTTDEAPEVGEEVYFGVELPIGDIAEVKASVISVEQESEEEEIYKVKLRILCVDNRYKKSAMDFLSGKTDTTSGKDGGPIWARALKQGNGSFASIINLPGGVITAEQLRKVVEISSKNAGIVKLTHAQRLILLINPDNIEEAEKEIESVGLKIGILHHGIRNIRGCCGALCRWSSGTNAIELSKAIADTLFGRSSKFDVKIAVSDCMRNCSEAYCADIGLVAKQGKYSVYVGGSASSVHIKGLKLTDNVSQDEAVSLLVRIIDWYDKTANERERLYKTLERLGEEQSGDKTEKLAEAADIFKPFDIDEDMNARLTKLLARCYGLKKMREELGL